jgi:hypothetical protein
MTTARIKETGLESQSGRTEDVVRPLAQRFSSRFARSLPLTALGTSPPQVLALLDVAPPGDGSWGLEGEKGSLRSRRILRIQGLVGSPTPPLLANLVALLGSFAPPVRRRRSLPSSRRSTHAPLVTRDKNSRTHSFHRTSSWPFPRYNSSPAEPRGSQSSKRGTAS